MAGPCWILKSWDPTHATRRVEAWGRGAYDS